jgi:GrpB-like predicted nucleotidyltransferase (UPF0157 family)
LSSQRHPLTPRRDDQDSTALSGRVGSTLLQSHAMLEIVPYDPRWALEFEVERDRIQAALGSLAVRIDHHGSTAVPGLAAKPVIDIQVSVARLHPIDPCAGMLADLGYVHVPHADDERCPFFHLPQRWPHTNHIHVVESGSEEERRTLAFRDYLRAHPSAAREYEALKRHLAGLHGGSDLASREAYASAKTSFIDRILTLALQPSERD